MAQITQVVTAQAPPIAADPYVFINSKISIRFIFSIVFLYLNFKEIITGNMICLTLNAGL